MCKLIITYLFSQCVIRATVTNLLDSVSGPQSALLLERSENAITDAIRLQVCLTEAHLVCL